MKIDVYDLEERFMGMAKVPYIRVFDEESMGSLVCLPTKLHFPVILNYLKKNGLIEHPNNYWVFDDSGNVCLINEKGEELKDFDGEEIAVAIRIINPYFIEESKAGNLFKVDVKVEGEHTLSSVLVYTPKGSDVVNQNSFNLLSAAVKNKPHLVNFKAIDPTEVHLINYEVKADHYWVDTVKNGVRTIVDSDVEEVKNQNEATPVFTYTVDPLLYGVLKADGKKWFEDPEKAYYSRFITDPITGDITMNNLDKSYPSLLQFYPSQQNKFNLRYMFVPGIMETDADLLKQSHHLFDARFPQYEKLLRGVEAFRNIEEGEKYVRWALAHPLDYGFKSLISISSNKQCPLLGENNCNIAVTHKYSEFYADFVSRFGEQMVLDISNLNIPGLEDHAVLGVGSYDMLLSLNFESIRTLTYFIHFCKDTVDESFNLELRTDELTLYSSMYQFGFLGVSEDEATKLIEDNVDPQVYVVKKVIDYYKRSLVGDNVTTVTNKQVHVEPEHVSKTFLTENAYKALQEQNMQQETVEETVEETLEETVEETVEAPKFDQREILIEEDVAMNNDKILIEDDVNENEIQVDFMEFDVIEETLIKLKDKDLIEREDLNDIFIALVNNNIHNRFAESGASNSGEEVFINFILNNIPKEYIKVKPEVEFVKSLLQVFVDKGWISESDVEVNVKHLVETGTASQMLETHKEGKAISAKHVLGKLKLQENSKINFIKV